MLVNFNVEDCIITHSVNVGGLRGRATGNSHRIIDMDARDFDDIRTVTISVVIITNVTLNLLVIVVLAKYPQLREDRTALFVFSLSLSDLANGCTSMPISAAVCSSATPNVRNMIPYLPRIHAVFSIWFTVNSLHSLCWVTVCKMVAITKPFRYEQVLTRNRCYFIICGIWLTGALFAATITPFVATWNLDACINQATLSRGSFGTLVVAVLIAIVCPAVAIVYCTTRIFLAIFRTHRQITAQVNSIGGQSGALANTPSLTLKSIRSGRNVLIICLAFLILTIPFAVYFLMYTFELDTHLPSSYTFVATWILLSNSSVNSLLYIVLFRSVREKTVHMLRGVCEMCMFR